MARGPAFNKIEWVFPTPVVTIGDYKAGKDAAAAGTSLNALQKSRIAWDSTRKAIEGQLKTLETAVANAVRKYNEEPSREQLSAGTFVGMLRPIVEPEPLPA